MQSQNLTSSALAIGSFEIWSLIFTNKNWSKYQISLVFLSMLSPPSGWRVFLESRAWICQSAGAHITATSSFSALYWVLFSILEVVPAITEAATCRIFSAFLSNGMTDIFYNPVPQSSRWCLPFLILYKTWYFFSVSHKTCFWFLLAAQTMEIHIAVVTSLANLISLEAET